MKRKLLIFSLFLTALSPISVSAESSRCHIKSLLPPVFRSTVQPLFPTDTCDDCNVLMMGLYLSCKKQGGNDCFCAAAAMVSCTGSNMACVPCQICVDWRDIAAHYCALEAPKAPPSRPGGN